MRHTYVFESIFKSLNITEEFLQGILLLVKYQVLCQVCIQSLHFCCHCLKPFEFIDVIYIE